MEKFLVARPGTATRNPRVQELLPLEKKKGRCVLVRSYLTPGQQKKLIEELSSQVVYRRDTFEILGKRCTPTRNVATMGDAGLRFSYTGVDVETQEWTPYIHQLAERLHGEWSRSAFVPINAVHINRYKGADKIGYHQDKEKDALDRTVYSVSLGATRDFLIRPVSGAKRTDTIKVSLRSGDLLIMYPGMQQHWKHSVPPRPRSKSVRWNLTYRTLKPRAKKEEKASCTVAIVGCRRYNDYDYFKQRVDAWIENHGPVDGFVSGGATGVDTMAERYAKEAGIPITVLRPDWRPNGRYDPSAGLRRNTDIVAACDALIAFPSPMSKGTPDSMKKAREAGKDVTVYSV